MTSRRLGPEEWQAYAEPALNSVFTSVVAKDRPFRDEVEARLILDLDGFFLSEEQFRAVCEGARAVSDESLLYSIVRGYLAGPELMAYYTWELPLFQYKHWYEADSGDIFVKDHDIGIPLDRVIYSPQGKWGVLLPELFALVGGRKDFIDRLKLEYPRWREDLDRFVGRRKEAARERSVDASWVPTLLQHIYGDDAPEFGP